MGRVVVFLVALALTLSVAYAQDPGSFYKPPTKVTTSAAGVNPTGKAAAGGISALLTMQGVDDSGRAAAYKTRGITYAPSTLGRIARAARGGPATILGALAFGALLDGAGWVIDELSGQVTTPAVGAATIPVGASYFSTSGLPGYYSHFGTRELHMLCNNNNAEVYRPTKCPGSLVFVSNQWYGTQYRHIYKDGTQGNLVAHVQTNDSTKTNGSYVAAAAIPQAQVDTAVGNAVADRPDTWNQVLREPDGRPRTTPEVLAALDDFRQELEAERGLTVTPDTPVDPNWEEQPNNAATDWPGFCSWASVVCDFIDWYKAPPADFDDQEMPQTELPVPVVWSSSLGQGSCPAPYTLSLTGTGPQAYEWGPWCDLASRIKPLVIASAAFAALLILAGVSRRSNGDA